MDSTRQGSSETSSDENDQTEKVNDDNTGTGRSYECTFCKRGFTNAQALGGHMNIHRKDKAKAKQVTDNSSASNKLSNEEYMACKYFAPISSDQAQYYAALGAQANYQMYFPASNPSYPHAYDPSHLPANSELSSLQEDRVGANLSLRIGLPPIEESEEQKKDGERNRKGNDVDLELRLGQNP